jgi:hypothetical protein
MASKNELFGAAGGYLKSMASQTNTEAFLLVIGRISYGAFFAPAIAGIYLSRHRVGERAFAKRGVFTGTLVAAVYLLFYCSDHKTIFGFDNLPNAAVRKMVSWQIDAVPKYVLLAVVAGFVWNFFEARRRRKHGESFSSKDLGFSRLKAVPSHVLIIAAGALLSPISLITFELALIAATEMLVLDLLSWFKKRSDRSERDLDAADGEAS